MFVPLKPETNPMTPASWDQNPTEQFDAHEQCQLWTHPHLWPMQGWDLLMSYQHGNYIIHCFNTSFNSKAKTHVSGKWKSWSASPQTIWQSLPGWGFQFVSIFVDTWRTMSSSPRQQLFAVVRPLIERRPHNIQITQGWFRLNSKSNVKICQNTIIRWKIVFKEFHRSRHCQCTEPCRSWVANEQCSQPKQCIADACIANAIKFLVGIQQFFKAWWYVGFPGAKHKLKTKNEKQKQKQNRCLESCLCGVW